MTDGTTPRVRRRRRPILALGATLALVMAVVTSTTGPAFADVDRVSGSATPLNVGGTVPSPTVSGEAIEPTDGYGPFGSGLLQSGADCPGQGLPGFAVPLTISAGLLEACTQGGGVATNEEVAGHLGFSESSASVANVVLGTTNLGTLASECRADGNGARGSTTVVGAPGIPTNPPVGFIPPQLPAGLLSLVLNEQIVNNTPGTATITVNAAHANILGIDIIIGQSVCNAFGPNVNVAPTTTAGVTTTAPPGVVTTTTAPPGVVTTTTPPGVVTTTTACPPATCPTTTTTRCPVTPCPTPTTTCPATCPPQQQCPTATACPTTTIKVGALVRTGSDSDMKVAWAAMALTLGGLFLMGSKGLPGQPVPASGPASAHTPPSGDGRRRSRRDVARDIFREMRRFK